MPMQTVWIDPELLLEHRGIRVFHTYKEDDYDQGARRYWFTVNSLCGELDRLCDDQPCRHVFDVRELSTWKALEQPPYCIDENDTPQNHAAWQQYWEHEQGAICTSIRAAIEKGELTLAGQAAQSEEQPTPDSVPVNSSPTGLGETASPKVPYPG